MKTPGHKIGNRFAAIAMALFLTPFLFTAAEAAEPKLRVATLNTVLADIARHLGGPDVEVVEIVRPDTDPHFFEPAPSDIREMVNADWILAGGLGFESYLDKLRDSVGSRPKFFVAGEHVPEPLGAGGEECHEDHDHSEHEHDHGEWDPHWWHSVSTVRAVAAALAREWSAALPGEELARRAAAFDRRLDELDKWARIQIAGIPRERRILVTSHDGLRYFARDYSFRTLPVSGITTTEQPSSQKARETIATIREAGVPVVFPTSTENPKVLGEITREAGVQTGHALHVDGLGGGEAVTFESMFRHNVNSIVGGLRTSTP